MTNSPEQAKQAIDADSVALLREMLERDPQLRKLAAADPGHHMPPLAMAPDFQSTAFGRAIHSCLEAKRHPHGDFAGVVDVLLSHGLKFDESQYPFGHDEIDRVVERYLGQ